MRLRTGFSCKHTNTDTHRTGHGVLSSHSPAPTPPPALCGRTAGQRGHLVREGEAAWTPEPVLAVAPPSAQPGLPSCQCAALYQPGINAEGSCSPYAESLSVFPRLTGTECWGNLDSAPAFRAPSCFPVSKWLKDPEKLPCLPPAPPGA